LKSHFHDAAEVSELAVHEHLQIRLPTPLFGSDLALTNYVAGFGIEARRGGQRETQHKGDI